MSIIKERTLTRRASAALVFTVILVAFLSFEAGGVYSSTVQTIASTTLTRSTTLTITNSTVSSFTMTSITVRTVTTFSTVLDIGPEVVLMKGNVTTRTLGTYPTDLLFLSATHNATFDAQVTNNRFSKAIPNHDIYNVFIQYGTTVANLNAGRCIAGVADLYIHDAIQETSWSC